MQKFLTSTALVLALTASGAAFAGSTQADVRTQALYGEPNAIAAAQWSNEHSPWASYADQRLQAGSQRASTATVPQGGWQEPAPASRDDLYHPD